MVQKKADPKETPEVEYVTKEDHEKSINTILEAIAGINKPEPSRAFAVGEKQTEQRVDSSRDASSENSNYTLNRHYQNVFNEYFAKEDNFEGRLENLNFTIIVPERFSNASSAHKNLYKVDLRMKVMDPRAIEDSFRKWCALVCQNLKYDKTKALR